MSLVQLAEVEQSYKEQRSLTIRLVPCRIPFLLQMHVFFLPNDYTTQALDSK